jgi:hypothetical protein
MLYNYKIKRIFEVLEEAGVEFPIRLAAESATLLRLDAFLESIYDDGYENGRDSVHACCSDECGWY